MSQTRRLAAILAADVAGYSRLMGADEEGTLAALKAIRRELADPKIKEHAPFYSETGRPSIDPELPIDRPQQMLLGHMPFERKLVE